MMKSRDDELAFAALWVKRYAELVVSGFLLHHVPFIFRRVAIALNSNKNKY